jgi:hypothetical protein
MEFDEQRGNASSLLVKISGATSNDEMFGFCVPVSVSGGHNANAGQ